jgi:hypothetical protein
MVCQGDQPEPSLGYLADIFVKLVDKDSFMSGQSERKIFWGLRDRKEEEDIFGYRNLKEEGKLCVRGMRRSMKRMERKGRL